MSRYTTTPTGVPVRQVTSHESFINIHPDHTGLIIGRGGSTIKKIQRDTGVDVLRIRKPNQVSGGMPWIQIRGHIKGVEAAYHRVLTIAQEADRRIPRMNVGHTQSSQVTAPSIRHPFDSKASLKHRPPPLQMPPPEKVAQQMGFSKTTEQTYAPESPAYYPNSPEFHPSYGDNIPPGPRTPSPEPKSPSPVPDTTDAPPTKDNTIKKLKLKRRVGSTHA